MQESAEQKMYRQKMDWNEFQSRCGERNGVPEGLKKLRENSGFLLELARNDPPGLKPALVLLALCGG
jgi:hypothetical protein